jgi:hypothetical protein
VADNNILDTALPVSLAPAYQCALRHPDILGERFFLSKFDHISPCFSSGAGILRLVDADSLCLHPFAL